MQKRQQAGHKADRYQGIDIYLHNGSFEFRIPTPGHTMGDDFDDPADDDGLHQAETLREAKERIEQVQKKHELAGKKLKSKQLQNQAKVVIGNGQRVQITGLHAKKLTPLFHPVVVAKRFEVNEAIDLIYPDVEWVNDALRELVVLRKRMVELVEALGMVEIYEGPQDKEGDKFSYYDRSGKFDDALTGLLDRMRLKRYLAERLTLDKAIQISRTKKKKAGED